MSARRRRARVAGHRCRPTIRAPCARGAISGASTASCCRPGSCGGCFAGIRPGRRARSWSSAAATARSCCGSRAALAPRWPAVSVTMLDRQDIVGPETRDGFRRLGWPLETVVGGCLRLSARSRRRVPTSSPPISSCTISRRRSSPGSSARRRADDALFVACEPRRSNAGPGRQQAALGDRLQRREPPRRGGQRSRRLRGPRAVGAVAGRAGWKLSRASRRTVHALLCGAGRAMSSPTTMRSSSVAGRPAPPAAILLAQGRAGPSPSSRRPSFRAEKSAANSSPRRMPRCSTSSGSARRSAALAGPEVRRVGLFAQRRDSGLCHAPDRGCGWGRALGREHLDLAAARARREAWRADLAAVDRSRAASRSTAAIVCRDRSDRREETLHAPIIVAAHGSWERGGLPTQPRRAHRSSDLLAFKAHFRDADLPADLMPLLAFPGGYGGMVQTDAGACQPVLLHPPRCAVRACARTARRRIAGEAVFRHIAESCLGVREHLGARRPGRRLARRRSDRARHPPPLCATASSASATRPARRIRSSPRASAWRCSRHGCWPGSSSPHGDQISSPANAR